MPQIPAVNRLKATGTCCWAKPGGNWRQQGWKKLDGEERKQQKDIRGFRSRLIGHQGADALGNKLRKPHLQTIYLNRVDNKSLTRQTKPMNRKMKRRHFPIMQQRLSWIYFRPMTTQRERESVQPGSLLNLNHRQVASFHLVCEASEPGRLVLGAHQALTDSCKASDKNRGHRRDRRSDTAVNKPSSQPSSYADINTWSVHAHWFVCPLFLMRNCVVRCSVCVCVVISVSYET